ncbi:hypothetical protein PENSPDRAFT_754254 [Peniophora sp. CONT]|nr:hypothetical protein PENSPDRAFT_754254 [Peniophora sp. CONT]
MPKDLHLTEPQLCTGKCEACAALAKATASINEVSSSSLVACALLALVAVGNIFKEGKRIDAPSEYCKLYHHKLRQYFYPNPVFNEDGSLRKLGGYDRTVEGLEKQGTIPYELVRWELHFICTHDSVKNATQFCGFICIRLERLFNHIQQMHYSGRTVTDTEKRKWADFTVPALFPDIPDLHSWLARRKQTSRLNGVWAMPELLYMRDLYPVRAQLEGKAREVLAARPNPDPVFIPTPSLRQESSVAHFPGPMSSTATTSTAHATPISTRGLIQQPVTPAASLSANPRDRPSPDDVHDADSSKAGSSTGSSTKGRATRKRKRSSSLS